ncbi:MAG: hypothetical protein ABGX68_09045 [Methylococcales bacterium]
MPAVEKPAKQGVGCKVLYFQCVECPEAYKYEIAGKMTEIEDLALV